MPHLSLVVKDVLWDRPPVEVQRLQASHVHCKLLGKLGCFTTGSLWGERSRHTFKEPRLASDLAVKIWAFHRISHKSALN